MIMTEQKWKGYTQGIRSIKAFEDENKINVSPFLLPLPHARKWTRGLENKSALQGRLEF